jgi:DNA-binding transcriptional MerR regulator
LQRYGGYMQDAGFTIRTMAERSGMTAHTLRYYERVGLIQPVGRARNGHRRYSEADAAWLHFLQCMRDTKMPIREMQRYAAMRVVGQSTREQRRQLLEDHRAVIAGKMAALERAHTLLTNKIASYRKIDKRAGVPNPAPSEATSPLAAAS